MDNMLFSIITCTFNRPELLQRAIRSVQQQTFRDYEHIIIDDGNNETTRNVVGETGDERIRYFAHTRQMGGAAALNTGIRHSRGNYITILDDDDELLPEFLMKSWMGLVNAEEDTGFIWTGILRIDETGPEPKVIRRETWPARFSNRESGLLVATAIGNSFGLTIRKSCFESIGYYDESLMTGFDTDLLMRLTEKYHFASVPEVLIKIHRHGDHQLTGKRNLDSHRVCYDRIIRKNLPFISRHWGVFYIHTIAYVKLCFESGMRLEGRKALMRLLSNDPGKLIVYADIFQFEFSGIDFRTKNPQYKLTSYLIRQTGVKYE